MIPHDEQFLAMRALVVDDDADIREFVEAVLIGAGCEVVCAADGDRALHIAGNFRPEIVFLDLYMPRQTGYLVCSKLKLIEPAPLIVLMTGADASETEHAAVAVHADDLIRKPFTEEAVLEQLRPAASAG